jgi:predicted nuclease of restriction endonuclease-like (RecB) superfamily
MKGKKKQPPSSMITHRGRVRPEADFPVPPRLAHSRADYTRFLSDIKTRIRAAQLRAVWAVNQELLLLYYANGLDLHLRFQEEAWGTGIIDKISADLRAEFPEMEGLSPRNLRRMRAFYRAYPLSAEDLAKWPRAVAKMDAAPWPPAVAKLSWAHNVILLEKVKDPNARAWYAGSALENGWSRDILSLQIETGLYQRKGKAVSNFKKTLPSPQSDLVQQMTRDPYQFGFLSLSRRFREKEMETKLVTHVKDLLLELGKGFAFIGNQVHLTVAKEDYFLDLLFYHAKLHCYVVIELKEGKFKPEYAGKMNFYLSAVDDLLRNEGDKPSIGLILCRKKNHFEVEYTLRDLTKPIGVAQWETHLAESLPEDIKTSLPTPEEIENEIGGS